MNPGYNVAAIAGGGGGTGAIPGGGGGTGIGVVPITCGGMDHGEACVTAGVIQVVMGIVT